MQTLDHWSLDLNLAARADGVAGVCWDSPGRRARAHCVLASVCCQRLMSFVFVFSNHLCNVMILCQKLFGAVFTRGEINSV